MIRNRTLTPAAASRPVAVARMFATRLLNVSFSSSEKS